MPASKNDKFFIFILFLLIPIHPSLQAQVKIKGYVRDRSTVFPLTAVTVMTNAGKSTLTDSTGYYEIVVASQDSIWFSFLNKQTHKWAVTEIPDPSHFDISILVTVSLPEVKVKTRNYKEDSIRNRVDYAKGFNYLPPSFRSIVPSIGLLWVTVDIDELIRAFQFQKKHLGLSFKKRLIEEEKEKFIDHRFTKRLVLKITGLKGDSLDNFMKLYRPGYEFTRYSSDYDFNFYIKSRYIEFTEQLVGEKKKY